MTTTHFLVIPADLSAPLRVEAIDAAAPLGELYRLIGCRTVDCVNENPVAPDLWVDEEGALTSEAPNYRATDLALRLKIIGTATYFHVGAYRGVCVLAESTPQGETVGVSGTTLARVQRWASMNAIEIDGLDTTGSAGGAA